MSKRTTARSAERAAAADDANARTGYLLNQQQAHQALRKAGINPEDRAALLQAAQGAEEHGGTPTARLARHALKWLPTAESETTVPLTATEAKALGLK